MPKLKKDSNDGYYVQKDLKKLHKLCDNLWHSFMGNQSNSAHWILGSDSNNVIKDDSYSPWALSVREKVEEAYSKHLKKINPSQHFDFDNDRTFNAFDSFLSIHGLINYAHGPFGAVYRIYQNAEGISYALRRYKDKYLQNFEELNKLLSDINGTCFRIFSKSDRFAKAYLIHQMAEIIYNRRAYPYNIDSDPVTVHLSKNHIHHDISRMMEDDLETIVKNHKYLLCKWIENDKDCQKIYFERIAIALIMAGRRYEYDHKFKVLLKDLGELFTSDQIKYLKGIFKRCKELKEKRNQESLKRYDDEYPELQVYGTHLYEITKGFGGN